MLEPGYGTENLPPMPVGPEVGLQRIDHVVGNVEKGKLDDWVRYYADVLGFGLKLLICEGGLERCT